MYIPQFLIGFILGVALTLLSIIAWAIWYGKKGDRK